MKNVLDTRSENELAAHETGIAGFLIRGGAFVRNLLNSGEVTVGDPLFDSFACGGTLHKQQPTKSRRARQPFTDAYKLWRKSGRRPRRVFNLYELQTGVPDDPMDLAIEIDKDNQQQ